MFGGVRLADKRLRCECAVIKALQSCLRCPVSRLLTQGSRNNKYLKAGVKILLEIHGKSTLKETLEILVLYVNSARWPRNQQVWGRWRGLVHSWLLETTWIISAKMTKTHVMLLWRSGKTACDRHLTLTFRSHLTRLMQTATEREFISFSLGINESAQLEAASRKRLVVFHTRHQKEPSDLTASANK